MIPDWLQRLDEALFLRLNGGLHARGGEAVEYLLKFHNQLGNAIVAVVVLGAALVLDPRLDRWVRRVLVVVLALGAVSVANVWLKQTVSRPRPLDALPGAFERGDASTAFGERASISSFPSGHASTVFAVATALAVWAGAIRSRWRRRAARTFLFVAAALTSLARIYAGMHFPLDVLAGAVLGGAAGWAATLLIRIPNPEVSP